MATIEVSFSTIAAPDLLMPIQFICRKVGKTTLDTPGGRRQIRVLSKY